MPVLSDKIEPTGRVTYASYCCCFAAFHRRNSGLGSQTSRALQLFKLFFLFGCQDSQDIRRRLLPTLTHFGLQLLPLFLREILTSASAAKGCARFFLDLCDFFLLLGGESELVSDFGTSQGGKRLP